VAANVFTIPASAPFAETLALGLVERLGSAPFALADATIYLPTRRAARTFGDAFARELGGATLLPQFKALGDVDDEELLFEADDEELELAPAIAPIRRRLLLTTMIRRWRAELSYAQASSLAASLARVMDELDTQNASFDELSNEIPAALAEHWSKVHEFLELLHTEDILGNFSRGVNDFKSRPRNFSYLWCKIAVSSSHSRPIGIKYHRFS